MWNKITYIQDLLVLYPVISFKELFMIIAVGWK